MYVGGNMSTLPRAIAFEGPGHQQPFQNTLGQVHSCLWMESEDGRLVADKVSLKKMDYLVAGLLEWVFLHTWRVMRLSSVLGQREIYDTHKQDRHEVEQWPRALSDMNLWPELEPLG